MLFSLFPVAHVLLKEKKSSVLHSLFLFFFNSNFFALTALVVAGIDILLVVAVHSDNWRLALEEALNVLVVVELVVTRRCLRGRLAVIVLVMGRDLTEHYAVVLL